MTDTPYLLPSGKTSIAFSGGRTSAYMLCKIAQANGGIPDETVVSFQNTGREFDETLDFVERVGQHVGCRIVWLEYTPESPRFQVVGHNSASRDGTPFRQLVEKRKMLPNRVARFCTAELKVHAQTRYLRSIGWRGAYQKAIGIRADEPQRIKLTNRESWTPWYPLADAGITKRDVAEFWRKMPFTLELEDVSGKTPRGNCDGCFLKSEANLAALARDHPDRARWWADIESLGGRIAGQRDVAYFNQRRPVQSVIDMVESQGDWIFDEDGALCQADDGECV